MCYVTGRWALSVAKAINGDEDALRLESDWRETDEDGRRGMTGLWYTGMAFALLAAWRMAGRWGLLAAVIGGVVWARKQGLLRLPALPTLHTRPAPANAHHATHEHGAGQHGADARTAGHAAGA
jgi:hypothetical protein